MTYHVLAVVAPAGMLAFSIALEKSFWVCFVSVIRSHVVVLVPNSTLIDQPPFLTTQIEAVLMTLLTDLLQVELGQECELVLVGVTRFKDLVDCVAVLASIGDHFRRCTYYCIRTVHCAYVQLLTCHSFCVRTIRTCYYYIH